MESDSNEEHVKLKEIPLNPTREQLYELAWSEPMLRIAERYKVSSSYLARVYTHLRVPRPAQGYWAKKEVGKAPPAPPLPEALAGDETSWNRDGTIPLIARASPSATVPMSKRRSVQQSSTEHRLLTGSASLYKKCHLPSRHDYLRPSKRSLPDIVVSENALEPALHLANKMYQALEERGWRVILAADAERFQRPEVNVAGKNAQTGEWRMMWTPSRPTVVYIDGTAIGLAIFERAESVLMRYVNGKYVPDSTYTPPRRGVDHTWTTTKWQASGRLCVQAYCPHRLATWDRLWEETPGKPLSGQLDAISSALASAVPTIRALVTDGERKAQLEYEKREAQWQAYKREEAIRKTAADLAASRADIHSIIDAWDKAQRIQAFFDTARSATYDLSADEQDVLLERINAARQLFQTESPLELLKKWRAPHER